MKDVDLKKRGEIFRLQQRMIGVLEFVGGIVCSLEALSGIYPITIGGSAGNLTLPQVPTNPDTGDSLLSPLNCEGGLDKESWGTVIDHNGTSIVMKASATFDIASTDIARTSNDIYQDFPLWVSRLRDYIDLVTKQRFHQNISFEEVPGALSLYHLSKDGPIGLTSNWQPKLHLYFKAEDRSVKSKQFSDICKIVSSARELSLEYQFQLAGYRAFKEKNFRLAIVESATAAEISLKNGLLNKMINDGVAYAAGLLPKFYMLGRLVDLAKIVGYQIPSNFKTDLIEPRNRVVHHGDVADAQTAQQALLCVDELLKVGSPGQFRP